jgi:hypothetical protein
MPTDIITGRDLYLRYTNPRNGTSYIQEHRVWGPNFMANQIERYDLGAEKGKEIHVTLATREEYRKAHWPNQSK